MFNVIEILIILLSLFHCGRVEFRNIHESFLCFRDRDRSGTRSENGFILGAGRCSSPSKENVDPDDCSSWSLGGQRPRRTARSCSGGRYRGADSADEATAKTYITIGPGKPTRIREHSPSKSAKLSSDESVTSARERSALSRNSSPFKVFDLNRSTSPSPQRKTRDNKFNANELNCRSSEKKKELFRDTSPLKSTNIFKNFRASKSDLLSDLDNEEKKAPRPFTTEKTFLINQSNKSKQNPKERRLSIEILNSCHRINEKNRASPESDSSQISSSTLSSFSSPLSSSSESFHSSSDKDKPANVRLSQRRISLEQRLNARTRINSPERCPTVTVTRKISETQTSPNGTTTTTTSSTSSFIYRKSSTCANLFSSKQPSEPSSSGLKQSHLSQTRPVPASRKISLQVTGRRPEPAPRRRSLSSLIEPSNSQRLETLECLSRVALVVTGTVQTAAVTGWGYLVLTVISMTLSGLARLTSITLLTNTLVTQSRTPLRPILLTRPKTILLGIILIKPRSVRQGETPQAASSGPRLWWRGRPR